MRYSRPVLSAACALAMLALMGCVWGGDAPPPRGLVVGHTTLTEILGRLGDPSYLTSNADGTWIVGYNYRTLRSHADQYLALTGRSMASGNGEDNALLLTFNSDGVLQSEGGPVPAP